MTRNQKRISNISSSQEMHSCFLHRSGVITRRIKGIRPHFQC